MTAHRFLAIRSIACLLACVGTLLFAAPAGATCLSLGGGKPPMVGVAALNTPADPIVSVDVWTQGPDEATATSWTTIPVTINGEFATGTSPFGDDGNARGTKLQVKEFIHKSGKRTPAPENPQVIWEERKVECDAAPNIPLNNAQPVKKTSPKDADEDEGGLPGWFPLAIAALLISGLVIAQRRYRNKDDGSTESWYEKVQPGDVKDDSERLMPEDEVGYEKRTVIGGAKPATPDAPVPASEDAPPPPAEPSILDEIDEGDGPPGLA